MGRARRNSCRLCMKQTTRSESTTINNLPKTFAHLLEEISGLKFTEADGLHMTVCLRCRDFLQAMEHHSQYPRSNKISGAGKKKVRRLMDKGFSAAEAIEKVIAEKRARDLIATAIMPAQADINVPVQAPRGAMRMAGSVGGVAPINRTRMSGAQRKKLQILLAGGMDRDKARELILAASRAVAGNQPLRRAPIQRATVQRGVAQRARLPLQKAAQQNGSARGTARPQKAIVQKGADQKAPQQRNAQVKGAPQKTTNGSSARRAPAQKAPAAAAAAQKVSATTDAVKVVSQTKRQANNPSGGGRTQNPENKSGAQVAPRRNERPAPYSRGNNRQQNQYNNNKQGDNFDQQSRPLEVGIVPLNFPNVQLDDMKLEALKEAITNEIFKIPQGGPLVRFLGTSSQNGWLKLVCADELSHNWLARLVSRWERAGVRMVEGNSLPQPVVLSLYLPGDFRSPEEILNILERQNNCLNTNQWRVINRETDANGQSITVCVDEQSLQALQSRDFMVFLGLGVVELKPRRFPSDGGTFNDASNLGAMRNHSGGGGSNNNSQGFSSNSGGGSGGMGKNYQSNSRSNNSGGGGSYQRDRQGMGQGYQRSGGYQSQRSW